MDFLSGLPSSLSPVGMGWRMRTRLAVRGLGRQLVRRSAVQLALPLCSLWWWLGQVPLVIVSISTAQVDVGDVHQVGTDLVIGHIALGTADKPGHRQRLGSIERPTHQCPRLLLPLT